ncbi:hypothetical protein AB0M47_25340 [Hamadaea sp. NPDC051192]|uniref:hypothetical protein n=1 Tax=Hamadaea sp. NPDC051192 TaxID=3154940 RepID=UPI003433E058
MAPAWRAYHPPELDGPELSALERSGPELSVPETSTPEASGPEPVADPWPQLPDDAELWSAVPPLFTTDRLARLDKEQAGA